MTRKPHITVCICTFRRPQLLGRLLGEVARQESGGLYSLSVVVADNDADGSGRGVVEKSAAATGLSIAYVLEPRQNIALARNAALAQASGEYVAFIDDDEFPVPTWLQALLRTCESSGADGVLGPVEPHFEPEPPAWVRRGGFYNRPRHATGFVMPWAECRTGNVVLRRSILEGIREPFRPEFGSGGEDQDFFRRMVEAGHRFVWCDEAVAREVVPASRWRVSFLLKRALLRGRNTFRHPRRRWLNLLKSCVALPIYLVALPLCLLVGFHWFMKFVIKTADHLGRVLAALGINPVRVREM